MYYYFVIFKCSSRGKWFDVFNHLSWKYLVFHEKFVKGNIQVLMQKYKFMMIFSLYFNNASSTLSVTYFQLLVYGKMNEHRHQISVLHKFLNQLCHSLELNSGLFTGYVICGIYQTYRLRKVTYADCLISNCGEVNHWPMNW